MSDEFKLKQINLSAYKHVDATRREVLTVIQTYKGLTFKFEPFVFNNGSSRDLLNLNGTIPVNYKGTYYHIPVCLWLMDTHPLNSPLCFVKPTAEMAIKVSKYVDHSGKIYLPYLHHWDAKSSNLLSLIQVMSVTFGEAPPVYTKIETNKPPYPTNSYMPQPSPGGYPGYPGGSGYPGVASPPYPVYNAAYPNMPYPNNAYNPPYPTPVSGYPGPAPAADNAGTITEEHIKASLLSAVEDKMRRRLREQFSQNQAELETLRRTQQELSDGKTRIEDILRSIDKEQKDLERNIEILQDKELELDKGIAKLSEQDGIDIDEAVTTTAPLFAQLVNAFAEEATSEDAIYFMGEALRRGIIDLDAFLKQVRELSRKQFTLRTLMQKCRQKAGLAC